jgi:GNAT superfamily N-acetyltransferase
MPVMLSDGLLGRRIVLRYDRRADDGRPPLADVVGELVGLTEQDVTVISRRGPVTIARQDVLIVRPVAANRRDILELERISRRGWRAAEQRELDGWLMFADRGWTGRANSVLPLRTPARPLEQLLATAREFYAERGLPLQIQVPLPARGMLDAELAARCWTLERSSIVLTAQLAPVPDRLGPAGFSATLSPTPAPDWLASYHYRGGALPDFALDLLTRHDTLTFCTIRHGEQVAAIARGVVDDGWLGVTAVEVQPAFRRRGLAGELMRQLTDWGLRQGAQRCYLQVDISNAPALALYDGLGFTEHHRYHYRLEPAAG